MADQDPYADFTPLDNGAGQNAQTAQPDPYADFTPLDATGGDQGAQSSQEPDYASMPWTGSEGVLARGAHSLGPSAAGVASGIGSALRDAAGNIAQGDLPGKSFLNAADTYANYGAHRLGQAVAPGLTSWIENKVGYTPPDQQQWDAQTAPIRALGQQYADRYGSWGGFKKALATDPVPVGLDVAALAAPAMKMAGVGGAGEAAAAASAAEEPATAASLGAKFREAATASSKGVDAAYDTARANPGVFTPQAVQPIWQSALQRMTGTPDFPANTYETSSSMAGTQQAVGQLYKQMKALESSPGGFNMNDLETVRRDLRGFADSGGVDSHHIGNLIDGFDEGIQQAAATPGAFSGDGARVVGDMQGARQAYINHRNTFGANAPQPIKNAMRALQNPNNLGEAGDQQIGALLSNGLNNNATGLLTRQHLGNIGLGDHTTDFLRNQLLSGSSGQVAANLRKPIAQQVFTPEEIQKASQLNETQEGSRLARLASPALRWGARAVAIGTGLHEGTLPGMLAVPAIEQGLEHLAGRTFKAPTQSLAERVAAPPPTPFYDAAARALQNAPKNALRADVLSDVGETDRQPHARGGKVKPSGHQHLVDRLMRAVETAKKAEQQRTSAILQQPDEHVAKALNVAQEAI